LRHRFVRLAQNPAAGRTVLSSGHPHWAHLQETGILWGMRFLLAVYRRFGRTAFRIFLYPVVTYYFLRNRTARRASRDYLRRLGAYYPELGLKGSLRESFRHFLSFAETLLDKIAVWIEDLSPRHVEFHNRHLLLGLLDQGRGAMLLGAHLGNLEICRALAELRDPVRINILVHTKNAEKFNRLLGSVERMGKVELIQVTELDPATAIRLQDKLAAGEFLVTVGDRTPVDSTNRTVCADFLGHRAEFPQGPYLLAALLRCPVYTLIAYPAAGKYHIHLEPFAESIELPRRGPERAEELARWASRYARFLEGSCRKIPLQWFNFYDFWGTDPRSSHD
jgi:predicted LPLAT superfamily acyltransferase